MAEGTRDVRENGALEAGKVGSIYGRTTDNEIVWSVCLATDRQRAGRGGVRGV